ncbi:MAG: isopentenyl-diphosphate delta-isomerase [Flavobacteriaceae bacterium]|nr:isopentenyl-diphosphate delta-isomerase [Flavobacteriaceae bacterium]|tara:strand:- start:14983 stop:15504 length:522 start_codon:yes stop_codon:yes gene_type:complete
MSEEMLILVDENDNQIGTMGKMEVHRKGLLHRAFSVFIINKKNELLLQQRAFSKYHSPGLWTNTCCSHQNEGETSIQAAKRRLNQEMGISTSLEFLFSFIYRAEFENGLIEHEFDHVIIGRSNQDPKIDKNEAESWKWVSVDLILKDLEINQDKYTVWFKIIFQRFYNYLKNR